MHGGINEMQKFARLPVLQQWRLKSAQHLLSILLKCTAFTKKVHKVQKVEKVAKSAHVHFCALKCNGVFIKKLSVIFCAHSTKCAQSAHSAQLFFLMCSFVHLKCIKFRAWVTDPHASSYRRPLFRAGHAIDRLLIFSFSLLGAVLPQR